MSIIGAVNGFPLLSLPLVPGARQVDWGMYSIVGAQENPYTGRQQIQNWATGYWGAVVTMPPMPRSTAAAWIAFLAQCQGMNGVFYYGDGLGAQPQGSAQGPGVTSGSFQQPYQLTTKNWTPSQFALLSPGDWIQVGYRLFQCMDQVQSDSQGNASFAIWPQIREIPLNGSAIITTNAQGLFRMKRNTMRYSVSYDRTYRLSFEIREAI